MASIKLLVLRASGVNSKGLMAEAPAAIGSKLGSPPWMAKPAPSGTVGTDPVSR